MHIFLNEKCGITDYRMNVGGTGKATEISTVVGLHSTRAAVLMPVIIGELTYYTGLLGRQFVQHGIALVMLHAALSTLANQGEARNK
jgi:hypothetical protein